MKRYRILVAFVSMAMGLLLWACRPELDSGFKGGDVQVTLFADTYRDVTVKSAATSDESEIKSVICFQFQGGNILKGNDGTPLIGPPITISSGDGVASIRFSVDERVDRIVYLANVDTNADFTDVATLSDLESKTVAWTANDLGSELVMYGVWKFGEDMTHIVMERAAVKINFNLRVAPELASRNEAFAISRIRLMNVPTIVYPFRNSPSDQRPSAGETYPEPPFSDTNYNKGSFEAEVWTDVLWTENASVKGEILTAGGKSWTWYMPENARGTGSATEQNFKTAETAPEGQADYCTYVEIEGYYNASGMINQVVYRVWLGEDNKSDYNLLRNTCYNVTSTIYGQHVIDTRINEKIPVNYWDYTDNATAWMMVAARDILSEGEPITTTSPGTCPEGWRLPNHKEGMLAWIYKDGDLGAFTYYWLDEEGENENWTIHLGTGHHMISDGATFRSNRCVKEN